MQCKKALEEAGGDMEKALMILKQKSSEIAAKKSDREAADGIVVVKRGEGTTALVTLHCETDFVAKNDDFIALANTLADMILVDGKDTALASADAVIAPVIQKIGENIKLGKIEVVDSPVSGFYTHNGKTGVVVGLSAGDEALAKDIAMHVAAMKPEYIAATEVTDEARRMAEEIFQKEVDESGKPDDIKKKMLDGKLSTYFKEQTLLDQAFIKDPALTVGALIDAKSKEEGTKIDITSLVVSRIGA